jgi:hypothetical protein
VLEHSPESDRAFVLIVLSKIDILLRQLLLARLQPNPTSEDPLFDGATPLSTLSAKIHLAHRLGIIGSDFARALHICRKIRNAFAHEISGCDLNLPPHKDRIVNLVLPMRGSVLFPNSEDSSKSPSALFRNMSAVLILGLELMRDRMVVIDSPTMTLQSLANATVSD